MKRIVACTCWRIEYNASNEHQAGVRILPTWTNFALQLNRR
jgi:hypothetical protein